MVNKIIKILEVYGIMLVVVTIALSIVLWSSLLWPVSMVKFLKLIDLQAAIKAIFIIASIPTFFFYEKIRG